VLDKFFLLVRRAPEKTVVALQCPISIVLNDIVVFLRRFY
jgi:hypothetical protein